MDIEASEPLSGVLVDYAQPLLSMMGEQPNRSKVEERLTFAASAWNATILYDSGRDPAFMGSATEMLRASAGSAAVELFEALVARKRREHADDGRLIGPIGVEEDAEGHYLVTAIEMEPDSSSA